MVRERTSSAVARGGTTRMWWQSVVAMNGPGYALLTFQNRMALTRRTRSSQAQWMRSWSLIYQRVCDTSATREPVTTPLTSMRAHGEACGRDTFC